MSRNFSTCFLALLAVWLAAPGCGSGGDDLFQGDNAGQAGQADASVDTAHGGTSGQAGATSSGGSAGKGGTSSGGEGGVSSNGGASGEAGSSGNPSTGGSPGSGGSPGAGGTAGLGGSAGSGGSLEAGCKSLCGSDFCTGATASNACLGCLNTVCKEIGDLYTYSSDLQGYQSCLQSCTESSCYDYCCEQYPKACWSGQLWAGCSCGWTETDCKPVCGSACSGGFMQDDCQSCVKPSPCGLALFKYHNAAQAGEFSTCRNNCNGDATCQQGCCNQYPQPCAARQSAIDCVCL